MKNGNANQNGYVALISAVLVSVVLLVTALPMARAAFWARFETLDRENKKIAANSARSCADLAMLKIARGETAAWDKCEIVAKNNLSPDVWEIIARGRHKNSFVNLRVEARLESGQIKILHWEEF
jgi:hypothetical protein